MNIQEIHTRIDEFKTLEKNWDSYDADPISQVAIECAHTYADMFPPSPNFASPLPGGGIQLEWEWEEGGNDSI